jgi:hypothetical protein
MSASRAEINKFSTDLEQIADREHPVTDTWLASARLTAGIDEPPRTQGIPGLGAQS